MNKFKLGDTLIPNRIIINDNGTIERIGTWCDYHHKYQVMTIRDNHAYGYTDNDHYQLKGVTNGRTSFFLPVDFVERNYTLEITDPECGSCTSMCKKGKRCGLYEERDR